MANAQIFQASGRPASDYRLLPRDAYVCSETFGREMEKVFHRQWQFLGHIAQLENVGDFFVEEICGESIIVIRESADRIGGFLNHCRHRGHQLTRSKSGTARSFTCPYHQWTYGLDGALQRAPGCPNGESFDYADFGLHRVRVNAWHGLIFCWLSEQDGPLLSECLDFDDSGFHDLKIEQVKPIFRESYDIEGNWKVLLENYLECYHCAGSHPELCVTMDMRATYSNTGDDWRGEYFAGHLQLKPGVKTGSMDGRLVSKPLGIFAGRSELPDGFGAGFGIVPSLTRVIFHVDHGIVHALRPIDVSHVRWETTWYVAQGAQEGKDYDVEKVTELWRLTNKEDISLCEGAYRGVQSRRFISGPLDRRREGAINSALKTYTDLMQA